jgi:hypothetical protein
MTYNGSQLAEVADLDAQIFGIKQMMKEAIHLNTSLHPQFWQGAVIGSFLGASGAQSKVGAVCYQLQMVATCQRAQHISTENNCRKVKGASPLLVRVEGCPQKIYYNGLQIGDVADFGTLNYL